MTDSGTKEHTMLDLTPRLRAAADYLTEHGWTQGTERDRDGKVCLTGAVRYCAPQNGDEYLIREVLRKRDRAEDWNDNVATEDQVREYLLTAEVTDADLAETFGPNWMAVVRLARRAATLTDDEVKRLAAAWDAAWDARAAARAAAWDAGARAAARAAAEAAAEAAAGDAVWTAAWDAAGAAARAAARDAAEAVVTRDLIGTNGYTAEHYQTLIGPWLLVCGDPFEEAAA